MYSDYNDGRFADDPHADSWNERAYGQSPRSARRRRDYYASRNDVYSDYYDGQTSSQPAYSGYYDASSQPYYEPTHYEASYNDRPTYDSGSQHQRPYSDYPYAEDPYASLPSHRTPSPPSTSIPTSPSPDYLRVAAEASKDIDDPAARKLIILDLNGTLLVRKERRVVHPRPYMPSFRDYLFAAQTRGWLDVMVWSSAQPHNVEKMVRRCFFDERLGPRSTTEGEADADAEDKWEGKLIAVWARDTLGLSRNDYSRKSKTTKDLAKPWAAFPNVHSARTTFLLDDSPAKVRLQPYNHVCISEYAEADRERDVDTKRRAMLAAVASVKISRDGKAENAEVPQNLNQENGADKEEVHDSAETSGDYAQEQEQEQEQEHQSETIGAGASTDIRADAQDSRTLRRKAKKGRKRFERQEKKASRGHKREAWLAPTHGREDLEHARYTTIVNKAAISARSASAKADELDATLLAVIGILDVLRHESNVAGWIRAGGLWAGGAPPAHALLSLGSPASSVGEGEGAKRAPSPTDAELDDLAPASDELGSADLPPSSSLVRASSPAADTWDQADSRKIAARDMKRQRSADAEAEGKGEGVATLGSPKKRARPDRESPGPLLTLNELDVLPAGNDAETLSALGASLPSALAPSVQDVLEMSRAKMWFEDTKTFRYWVEGGRAALRELGIEERDGITF